MSKSLVFNVISQLANKEYQSLPYFNIKKYVISTSIKECTCDEWLYTVKLKFTTMECILTIS